MIQSIAAVAADVAPARKDAAKMKMKLIMENFKKNVTSEAMGSTAGEGMPIDRAFKHAMKYAASKGLNLGHAQKVRLKDWVRDNIANKNMSDPDGNKTIEAAIDSKEAYR